MSKQYFSDEFKIEAVKQITELGYSTSEVASRLGVQHTACMPGKSDLVNPKFNVP